jgi:ABC-2 type transport system ATP-binding protein
MTDATEPTRPPRPRLAPATPTAPAPAAARPTAALELDHVSRWYGNVVAVNDISFGLGRGGDRPARPERRRQVDAPAPDGRPPRTVGRPRPRRGRERLAPTEMYRHIGLVPERETVHAYLTGLEFARLNARLQGVADPDAAAARAIATVDLTEAADRPIGTYSKGMRQRAKIAGALVHDPSILLLDEPFNGMDPRQRLHMMTLLRSMAAAGRTILFSSHILEEVERLADSVLVVYAGRLAAAGDFRSIRRLMTDRPHTFTVSSSDDRRLAVGADGRRVGVRSGTDRWPGRHPDRRLRGIHTVPAAHRARDQGHTFRGGPDGRLARERLQLPGAPMTVMAPLIDVTLRGLLGRRRTLLLVLLVGLPVLISLLIRISGGQPNADRVLDTLVVRRSCLSLLSSSGRRPSARRSRTGPRSTS